jgi:UrcA family protein
MTRLIIGASSAALAALTSTAASATPQIRVDSQNRAFVGYQDLDLQSERGRKTLAKRIRFAAGMVCTDRTDLTPLIDDKCYRAAISSGASQTDGLINL